MRVRVPIFMFHHVVGDDQPMPRSSLFVSAGKLRGIASWFIERGYESITVSRLAMCLAAGDELALRRKFVLTFDDGAKNNYHNAYPVLAEMKCTATFYVPTDYVGGTSDWRRGKRAFEIMGGAEIKNLSAGGFEIGSHGCRHIDFTSLSVEEVEEEMAASRDVLSSIIGMEVQTFAYPYGLFDSGVLESASRAGYRAACTTIRGAIQDSEHIFALKRIMITEGTGHLRLRYFVSGLLDFEHRKEFRDCVEITGGNDHALNPS